MPLHPSIYTLAPRTLPKIPLGTTFQTLQTSVIPNTQALSGKCSQHPRISILNTSKSLLSVSRSPVHVWARSHHIRTSAQTPLLLDSGWKWKTEGKPGGNIQVNLDSLLIFWYLANINTVARSLFIHDLAPVLKESKLGSCYCSSKVQFSPTVPEKVNFGNAHLASAMTLPSAHTRV